ncbi:hypothetical protein O181_074026 [Austropuccinia psidii MF-1]|uniref:Uncharacterized protein n=1 Tax=Austropuccinia psidii MF-1 TaxID=1389203 RepID=A0A9Q3I8U8_9BASI|nr:hypothetical protein [Austropuccinia psidii MF-1]
MSFDFTPLPSALKLKKPPPHPLSHSENHSDGLTVRTRPDSAHHQNDLKYYETIIPTLDFMVRTKPNIENHEVNNTKTNHKRKFIQSQIQQIHDSKQIMSHPLHLNREYKTISTISIEMKAANSSWSKLPSLNTLPHSYLIIDKTKKPFLPVIIYEIMSFGNYSGHSQISNDLIPKPPRN